MQSDMLKCALLRYTCAPKITKGYEDTGALCISINFGLHVENLKRTHSSQAVTKWPRFSFFVIFFR